MHNRHNRLHEEAEIPQCDDSMETHHNKMHGYVIVYLMKHEKEEVFQRDIEEAMNIRRSTATVLLQRMEKAGMLTREPVTYDARLKRIVLTDRAKELYHKIGQELATLEEVLTQGLSEEELEQFSMIMDKMKSNLRNTLQ